MPLPALKSYLSILLAALAFAAPANAAEAPEKVPERPPGKTSSKLELKSEDDRFYMHLSLRLQVRYTYEDLTEPPDERTSSFRIRRARLKLGGHGFRPWLTYFFEYDFPSNSLLDARVTVGKFKPLQLQFGQWKVQYNRERVDSSGKQQLVDRSIVNTVFTLDRQIGAELLGQLFEGTPAYIQYGLGVFTGTGLNEVENDDNHMLWLGRLRWNFLGRDVDHSQSDPKFTKDPRATLGIALATNRTNRVRFPQQRDLGEPGQYRIEQAGQEFAFRYQGVFVQQEAHAKVVRDLVNGTVRRSQGGYIQAGAFPNRVISAIPEPLEIAARYAVVDPNLDRTGDFQREITVGANWFFEGHNNKLSVDVQRLTRSDRGEEHVLRVQWDGSF